MQKQGARIGGNGKPSRYPREYKSWILWEVALPLAAPLIVFLLLLAASHEPDAAVHALISVGGSGDLFIFGAFLLINVGAKSRTLSSLQREHW